MPGWPIRPMHFTEPLGWQKKSHHEGGFCVFPRTAAAFVSAASIQIRIGMMMYRYL